MSSEAGGGRPRGKSGGAGRRAGGSRAREISAGGVVVKGHDVVVIVPARRAADGSRVLGLPKGHVDPGETAVEAAAREVREEAGVTVEPIGELGDVRYWYRRDGRRIPKTVSFFLFRYVSGDPADHDDEIEEARWMGLAEAQNALSYEGERQMVARALSRLQQDR
jgi:8-oxo-dGTP pyrophosphatase MutT (NUDIX family)